MPLSSFKLGGLALALLFVAPASSQGRMSSAAPPERFQGEGVAVVVFSNNPHRMCADHVPDIAKITRIHACTLKSPDSAPIAILPNPCLDPTPDYFSHVYCHELGHVNGWSGMHER